MTGSGRSVRVARLHPRIRVSERALAAAIALLDSRADSFKGGCPPGELSVAFMTGRSLARIHGRFLADPSPTDVITFGGDPALGSAGEICVSVDAGTQRAGPLQGALSAELTLYVVHGWLHLAGYDDRKTRDRQAMRRAERRALALLRRSACVPTFKLA